MVVWGKRKVFEETPPFFTVEIRRRFWESMAASVDPLVLVRSTCIDIMISHLDFEIELPSWKRGTYLSQVLKPAKCRIDVLLRVSGGLR
jgi:hypothetical protein